MDNTPQHSPSPTGNVGETSQPNGTGMATSDSSAHRKPAAALLHETISLRNASRRKKLIMGALVCLLVLAGIYLWITWYEEETDDAYVDGHVYTITPRVAGYVDAVLVENNQLVGAGQLLAKLDPTDFEVALAKAKADLSTAESQLAALELQTPLTLSQTDSRVAQANAQLAVQYKNLEQAAAEEEAARQSVVQARAQEQLALLDMRRFSALLADGAVAQSAYDNAQTALATTRAQLKSAQAQLNAQARRQESLQQDIARLKADIRLAATGHDEAHINEKQAQAQLAKVTLAQEQVRQAELDLSYTRILSPVAGFVTNRSVEPGKQVAEGQTLLAVVPLNLDELWITANYKETQLTHMRPGQPVSVRVDTYPGTRITGRVDSIMAGTGAAFSLFPPENASGNFVKVVQRIPVKIVLEASPTLPELRIGMSAVVTVHTDEPAQLRTEGSAPSASGQEAGSGEESPESPKTEEEQPAAAPQ